MLGRDCVKRHRPMIVFLLFLVILILLFGAGAMRSPLGVILILADLLILFTQVSIWLHQYSAMQIALGVGGVLLTLFVGVVILIMMLAKPHVLEIIAPDEQPVDPQVMKLAEAKRAFEQAKRFLDDEMLSEADAAFSCGNYNEIWAILRRARQG